MAEREETVNSGYVSAVSAECSNLINMFFRTALKVSVWFCFKVLLVAIKFLKKKLNLKSSGEEFQLEPPGSPSGCH